MDVLCEWKIWRIKDGRMMNAVEIYIYGIIYITPTFVMHSETFLGFIPSSHVRAVIHKVCSL